MINDQKQLTPNPFLWWLEFGVRHGVNMNRLRAKGESLNEFHYFYFDSMLATTVAAYVLVKMFR